MRQAWQWVLVITVALGIGLPRLACAKPPAGIDLKVQVGYDGFVQVGRINPVIVDLKNASGGKNIDGELVLKYNDTEYVTPLSLPTPSEKRIFLYFPCDNYPPFLTLQVRSKQWTESFDINSFFKSSKAADTSILVLGGQSGSLGVLNQLDTVRLHRNLYETGAATIGSSKTFVGYFKLDEIDPNPKFFARADVIVLANLDYQQVTPQLAEALKASVAGGTGIVFSLGLNGAEVARSPLADLCPLQVTGTQQLTDLGLLGRRYGIQSGGAQATYATGRLAPGATVVADSGGVPAVVRRQWGSGTVTALAFDFTARPFKQNTQLAALFLDTALAVPQNVEVKNWFVHPEPLTKILQRLSEADPMPPHFVLLFLLAYTALVGPVNFLLLRQLKRQTLVWTTIPLIIMGFGYAGLETGRLTRGSDNVTSAFQEMHVYPGASFTPYQTVMLVFTAERTRYKLEVPDKSAFLFSSIPQQLEGYSMGGGMNPARQFRGLTNSRLDNSGEPALSTTQGKWTSKEYFYQGYAQLPVAVTTNLSARPTANGAAEPTGSFTLDLPFDLQGCYLTSGSGAKPIGKLAGKGSYDIAKLLGQRADNNPADLSAAQGGLNYLLESQPEIGELQRASSLGGLLYRDELLLVGFTGEVQSLAKFARPHRDYELTMVVVHLPYQPRPDRDAEAETRTLIAGGTGFEVNAPWAYGGSGTEELEFQADGYVDLDVQLLGKAAQATRLTINTTGSIKRGEQLQDLAQHVEVFGWSGSGWRQIRLSAPSASSLDMTLSGLADSTGRVRLRLVARDEGLKLSMPHAEAFGSIG